MCQTAESPQWLLRLDSSADSSAAECVQDLCPLTPLFVQETARLIPGSTEALPTLTAVRCRMQAN